MTKNIKDIEFAFFSQLAYLNWNNININELKYEDTYINKNFIKFLNLDNDVWNKIKIDESVPKVENGILMYNESDKRLFGVFGIEKNKNNSELMNPLYNFDGWQFIYSADKTKLYKDKYNLDNIKDDGFYATAFLKNDTEIIIAYRGTEPTTITDLLTDIYAGFLNKNHSQLVCAYLFIEHVKSLYPNISDENIYITGHSLGGCLAQYAFLSTNKKHKTVTWNALGVGQYRDNLEKNLFGDIEECLIFLKPLAEYANIYKIDSEIQNEFISSNTIILESENDDIQKLKKIIDKNITYSKDILQPQIEFITLQIYWLLKSVLEIQKTKSTSSTNIVNYYNSLDWTADLQTREGKCIDVFTGNEIEQEEIDDSKFRILLSAILKRGLFKYHGVNDFLIYMDKNGMVQAGLYNLTFTKNLIKTLYENILNADKKRHKKYQKLDFLKEGTTNKTEKEKPFLNFHTTCTKTQRFGIKQTEIENANIKYILPAKNALSSDVAPYIPYREFEAKERANGSDEVGVFIIGQVANVTLGGIKGGDTIQLIKVGESIQKQSLAEQITEIKNKKKIDIGTCIGWGTKGGSTEYDVIKYSDGTIVRQPRYV